MKSVMHYISFVQITYKNREHNSDIFGIPQKVLIGSEIQVMEEPKQKVHQENEFNQHGCLKSELLIMKLIKITELIENKFRNRDKLTQHGSS